MQWYCRLYTGLIILQLDTLIWETASPRTHWSKIVNESLTLVKNLIMMMMQIFTWYFFVSVTIATMNFVPLI